MGAGGGLRRGSVALQPYVEEDQEEEGQDAPLEGESWQAPQHGPRLTNRQLHTPPIAEAPDDLLHSEPSTGRFVAFGHVRPPCGLLRFADRVHGRLHR